MANNNLVNKLTIIKCGENRKKQNQDVKKVINLNMLIEKGDAETLYKLFVDKKSGFDDKVLLESLFKTGDLEYISRAVMYNYNKCITKEVFLRCAKMIVESKNIDLIIEFSIGCFGNLKTFGNSFDIIDEYIEMIKELHDKKLVKEMISLISLAQRIEVKENTKAFFDSLIHGEFDYIISGEYKPFMAMVYPEEIKFKRRLQGLGIKKVQSQGNVNVLSETI